MNPKIIVGIISFNEEKSIKFSTQQVDKGLSNFFNPKECLIINADSNSHDHTKEIFLNTKTLCPKKYLLGGLPKGKGRNIFKLFKLFIKLKAKYLALIDGDVISIRPDWIKLLIEPLINNKADYVLPLYQRKCYDSNVTYHFTYPLVYSIYGVRIRQPIGGEFGLSRKFILHLLKQKKYRVTFGYGIDIFMTGHALGGGFKVKETFLGQKIHKPGFSGLMLKFHQVVESAILTTREFVESPNKVHKPVFKKNINTIIKTKPIVDDKIISFQLKENALKFYKYRKTYPSLVNDLMKKMTKIFQSGQPTILSELWTTFLARFLNFYFSEKLNQKLLNKYTDLIAPVFFWRTMTFWREIKSLSADQIAKKLDNQAEKLRDKIELPWN